MAELLPTNGRNKKPSYRHDVSLGNIISILAMLGTLFIFFSEMRGDIRVLAVKVNNNSSRITVVEQIMNPVNNSRFKK